MKRSGSGLYLVAVRDLRDSSAKSSVPKNRILQGGADVEQSLQCLYSDLWGFSPNSPTHARECLWHRRPSIFSASCLVLTWFHICNNIIVSLSIVISHRRSEDRSAEQQRYDSWMVAFSRNAETPMRSKTYRINKSIKHQTMLVS
jgi:hypothetical protein